jgi:tetratricopeptide (TPR) repeat protein
MNAMLTWILAIFAICLITGILAIRLLATPRNRAAYHFHNGVAAMSVHDYHRAVASFSEAIELDADFLEAYYNRGFVRIEMNRCDEAIADLTEAIRCDPASAKAFSVRGLARAKLRRFDEAIADCNKSVELDPVDAGNYGNRGRVHLDRGDCDEAIGDSTRAVELDPSMAPAHLNRAFAHFQTARFREAIADCERVIELRPDDPEAFSLRADALRKVDEETKAPGAAVTLQVPVRTSDEVTPYHMTIAADLQQLAGLSIGPEIPPGEAANHRGLASRCAKVTAAAKSYCSLLTLSTGQTEQLRLELDFEAPDRFLVTQSIQNSDRGKLYDQWVTIGTEHYRCVGLWFEMPQDRNDGLNASLLTDGYLKILRDADAAPSAVHQGGDGKYVVLRYRDVQPKGVLFSEGTTKLLDIWIEHDTTLLTKCETIQEAPDPSTNKSEDRRLVHVFTAFDRELGIKAPHVDTK